MNMNKPRHFLVIGLLFLFAPVLAWAYNPTVNTTTIPYEVVTIDNQIESMAEYLGELKGDPQMYEFTIGAEANLKLRVIQLETNTPIPFSLIAVRQNNQNAGVVEVGRLRAKDTTWEKVKDNVLGLTFLKSGIFETKIGPGVYRVEVSTPDNFGSYMLTIGDGPISPGYFNTLGDIRTIQKFFGKSIFAMLRSSYVYYPIGILILCGLIYMTWRKRNLILKNA
jgi:hypothetical protein